MPCAPLWNSEQVSFVQNSDPLFYVSLRDNILVGREISEDRYREVIEAAALSGVILEPNARIGSYQVDLSAGQQQRVRLARGIVSPAIQVLLLDEPFNGLDDETREKVWQGIDNLHPNAAIVVVTHRVDELSLMQERYEMTPQGLVRAA